MKKRYIIKCQDDGFTTKWSEDLTEISEEADKHKAKNPDHRLVLHTEIRDEKDYS